MLNGRPTVFVVDDDLSMRESLALLIESAGWQPETFASGLEFLARPRAVSLDSEDRRRYEKLNPYREAGRAALGDLQQRMTGSMKDLAGLGGV
jgi:hypothetical protein